MLHREIRGQLLVLVPDRQKGWVTVDQRPHHREVESLLTSQHRQWNQSCDGQRQKKPHTPYSNTIACTVKRGSVSSQGNHRPTDQAEEE